MKGELMKCRLSNSPKLGFLKRFDRIVGAGAAAAAAATGAGVVGPVENADAAVVYSGPVNIAVPNNIDGVYLNVVTGQTGSSGAGVPGYDINPYSAAAGNFNLWGPDTATWKSNGGVIAGPYNLPDGTVIDGTGTYFRPGGGTNVGLEMNLNSDRNCLGYEFVNEAGGGTHYGWVRFQFGADAGTRSIVGYAYDDVAGAGIGCGVVPEPAALGLLAMGAAGLAAARRRRA
jgi:hypothetical protein